MQQTKGRPTVILAKTVKGYGMGDAAEGKNIAHQVKKMDMTHVLHLRDRSRPTRSLTDEAVKDLPYLKLDEGSKEYEYLHARRKELKGYTPQRLPKFTQELALPELEEFGPLLK